MSLEQENDHVGEGLKLLIEQYKNQPKLEAILTSYLTQIQEIEDVAFDILSILLDIGGQVGEQLDLLGRLVGQPRNGLSDAEYILFIQARILINKSSGRADELLRVVEILDPLVGRAYQEFQPASFVITLSGVFSGNINSLATLLGETRAGGVWGFLLYSPAADSGTFFFSTGDTEEASTTQGWANDAQTNGGLFSDIEELP